jgi:uncharacterized protein (TIGR03066 family)
MTFGVHFPYRDARMVAFSKEHRMNLPRRSLVVCFVVGLFACGAAAREPSNKEKIVGNWEIAKGETVPPGTIFEFAKDGKMKMRFEVNGKKQTLEAEYTVEDDKLTLTLLDASGKPLKARDGKEAKETVTITRLTDEEFVVKDQKGKVDQFKKKK